MLQQTRVEAVIPYYERFLGRFPSVKALAAASENEVLAFWSGLGYYSRACNLHRAAKLLVAEPATCEEIRALPGVGPYTAAAIASIALGLPYAAVDGNVIRVISRLTDDASEITSSATRRRFAEEAQTLLDKRRPGDFNQAMMELGATICVPRTPRCAECPAKKFCAARAAGTTGELPVKLKKKQARGVTLDLLLLENEGRIFLVRRSSSERRLAGFLELPEKRLFAGVSATKRTQFGHRIVNDQLTVTIWTARLPAILPPGEWHELTDLAGIPMTTVTKKALARREL